MATKLGEKNGMINGREGLGVNKIGSERNLRFNSTKEASALEFHRNGPVDALFVRAVMGAARALKPLMNLKKPKNWQNQGISEPVSQI